MSLKLLKRLLSQFRKKAHCPSCDGRFDEESMFVLATLATPDGSSCNALVFIVCPECSATSFATIGMGEMRQIETSKVSINEVLDMHNFLKGWQGNFKDLLV